MSNPLPENDPKVTVGSKVQLKTTFGDTYTGKIFAFDARSATLTLVEENKHTNINVNKRVLKTQFIADISLISRSSGNEAGKLVWPKKTVVQDRLKRAVEAAKKSEQLLGSGVTEIAQKLMDHLAKQYLCAWEGKTIVLKDLQIKIHPPYGEKDVQGTNSVAMNRIKMFIESIQSK